MTPAALDPDWQPESPEGRPAHLRPGLIGLVVLGGALGTLLRQLIGLALPVTHGWPLGTASVNVVGSFALGVLVARAGARRPALRALVGTGLLGGFTTYSSLALETVSAWPGHPWVALSYPVGSVLLGIAAAALGVRAGSRLAARVRR